jgi:hypothetical protein
MGTIRPKNLLYDDIVVGRKMQVTVCVVRREAAAPLKAT